MTNTPTLSDPQHAVDVMRRRPVLVAGAGVAGRGVIAMLKALDAQQVTVADDHSGLAHVTVEEAIAKVEDGQFDLVITSPGWAPTSPLLVAAADRGVPIIGDIEAAWLTDRAEAFGPARTWAAITGTNGKTTTTAMLTAMCVGDGRAAMAVGNIGVSPALALTAESRGEPRADILVAEVSSFQLHWAPTFTPEVGCVLNIAEDHLDWHGDFAGYAADKARVLRADYPVFSLDDAHVMSFYAPHRVANALGFTAGDLRQVVTSFDSEVAADAVPAAGDNMNRTSGTGVEARDGATGFDRGFAGLRRVVGVSGDNIVMWERGHGSPHGTEPFASERELAPVAGISPPGPAGISDASAAAAMACAIGVSPAAIAQALSTFRVQAHRGQVVYQHDGVTWVDNSKATNPHAAVGALRGQRNVIWVAGGQLKGASVVELIEETKDGIKALVALGVDRQKFADEMRAQAPETPVTLVDTTDPDQAMEEVVRACADYAESGDTVVLAPAAASLDMYTGMAQRGDLFAQYAVQVELR